MRDLDLLNRWLVRQRQSALRYAHTIALVRDADLLSIKAMAVQAEFCDRVREATVVLANSPERFIRDFLGGDGESE